MDGVKIIKKHKLVHTDYRLGMLFLIQFLDEWLDFRYAEFFSLLSLHGYKPHEVVRCCTSTEENRHIDDYQLLNEEEMKAYWKKKRESVGPTGNGVDHFMIVDFPDEKSLLKVCERSVLIKNILELWSIGRTFEENLANTHSLPPSFVEPRLAHPGSWAVQVLTFGKTFSMEEKQAVRIRYSFLDFHGPVHLKQPENDYWLIVDYSRDIHHPACSAPPFPTYFGKRIGGGAMKSALVKYDLKKRMYLGPTTLDDALAFIMSNLAQVRPHTMALEPFVGTGSIAIAMEHFGAMVMGTDIDPRVLRGEMYAGAGARDIKRDVRGNFEVYGLPVPDLIRMDAHLFQRHLRISSHGLFESIVTDPPYGIRAGAKKSGKRAGHEVTYSLTAAQREDHIPSTQTYPVEEVMLDLLQNATQSLVLGGRLVYLIPTTYDFTPQDLPWHPCLVLEEICHQYLSARHGRRAVVMRKERALGVDEEVAFAEYKHRVLTGQDDGFGKLMGKLQSALAGDAHENDTVVKVLSNCGERRRQGREFRKQMRETGLAFPTTPENLKRLSKKELKRRAVLDQKASALAAEADSNRQSSSQS